MAYEIPSFKIGTLKAAADYSSTGQFLPIAASSSEGIAKLPASSGAVILGILQNAPVANEACEIWGPGCVTKAVSGSAALDAGDRFYIKLASSSGTYCVLGATSSANTGDVLYGPVLENTASTGDIITVAFFNQGVTT